MWRVVIRNDTQHAVTFESRWPGQARWATVTLLPGQVRVRDRADMAFRLKVLYETPTNLGPQERLALLSPFSIPGRRLVHSFRDGPGGEIVLR
jgi:hypothetical protein